MAAGAALALAGPLVSPAAALTIELKDVASDRVERQRAFAEGRLPLPGTPDLADLTARLAAGGHKPGTPMFIRIFKEESELELWYRRGDRFVHFATYPMCHWSGTLGPKMREGDRQNPEGFYTVTSRLLHRVGRWPRSLNIGFPNAFDRAFGRTGSYILVHGGCSSTGCFAMTNAVIEEIYTLTEQAIRRGQDRVHVHVFPFRMTEANMDRHRSSEWFEFWQNLKEGYDAFEATRVPPKVAICDKRYLFQRAGPEEVGDPGPLALCGDPRATTAERKDRTPSARRAGPPLPPPQSSLRTSRHGPPLESRARVASVPQTGAETTSAPRAHSASAPLPAPSRCNPASPSCQGWSSLRAVGAASLDRVAAKAV
jgi:murein L,D-transpeptidase YafK